MPPAVALQLWQLLVLMLLCTTALSLVILQVLLHTIVVLLLLLLTLLHLLLLALVVHLFVQGFILNWQVNRLTLPLCSFLQSSWSLLASPNLFIFFYLDLASSLSFNLDLTIHVIFEWKNWNSLQKRKLIFNCPLYAEVWIHETNCKFILK